MSSLLLQLLLLVGITDALIKLRYSELYDEKDFKDVAHVDTTICSLGCKVYAAISKNDAIPDFIFVSNPNTQKDISITALSKLYLQDSHEKAYLEIGKAPTVTIYNRNTNKDSAPLALWIVSTQSPYYDTAEVFDPAQMARVTQAAPHPVTFLAAQAFRFTVLASKDSAVFARSVGYDGIDKDNVNDCFAIVDTNLAADNSLSFTIDGPLATVRFGDTTAMVDISTNLQYEYNIEMNGAPHFITSPGFVCGGPSSYEVFHSSEFFINAAFTLTTPQNQIMRYHFEMDVVSDEGHPVTLLDVRSQTDLGFYGNFQDRTNYVELQYTTNTMLVNFNPGPAPSFFAARVWAESLDAPQSTSSRPIISSTTTLTPTTSSSRDSIRLTTILMLFGFLLV